MWISVKLHALGEDELRMVGKHMVIADRNVA